MVKQFNGYTHDIINISDALVRALWRQLQKILLPFKFFLHFEVKILSIDLICPAPGNHRDSATFTTYKHIFLKCVGGKGGLRGTPKTLKNGFFRIKRQKR